MNETDEFESRPTPSPYTPLRRLGEGASGSVDLARDERCGRLVALKKFHSTTSAALDEAALLAGIVHPGVVRLLDAYRERPAHGADRLVAVYEYVEGPDVVTASRGTGFDRKLAVFARALRALAFVHRRGVLHRDLKPANILAVDPAGGPARTVLIDFGFAAAGTESSPGIGTLRYLAPESMDGAPPSTRSDLYALGIVLYEMLVGSTPSHGLDAVATVRRHRVTDFELPPSVAAEVPARVRDLVAATLRRVPEERPASADEAIELLEAIGLAALDRETGQRVELEARIRSLSFGDAGALASRIESSVTQSEGSVVVTVPEGSDDAMTRARIELARRGIAFIEAGERATWVDLREHVSASELALAANRVRAGAVVLVDDEVPIPDVLHAMVPAWGELERPSEASVLEAVEREFGIEFPMRLLAELRTVSGFTPRSVRAGLERLLRANVIHATDGRVSIEPWRPPSLDRDPRWTHGAARVFGELSALESEWIATLAAAPLPVDPAAVAAHHRSLNNPAAPLALDRLVERRLVARHDRGAVALTSHALRSAVENVAGAGTRHLRRSAIAAALSPPHGRDAIERGEAGILRIDEDVALAVEMLLDAGRELRIAGRASEAEKYLTAAAGSFTPAVPSTVVRSVRRWLADTKSFLGDDGAATELARQVLAAATVDPAAADPAAADDAARCRAILARAELRRGRLEPALREIDAGLAIEGASAPTRSALGAARSLALRRLGRLAEAVPAALGAVDAVRSIPCPEAAAAWMEFANVQDDRGDVVAARDALARACEVGQAIGRAEVFAVAASNLGRLEFLHGRTLEAIVTLAAALEAFESVHAVAQAESTIVLLLFARNTVGDLDGARSAVLRGNRLFGPGSTLRNRAMFWRHAAEVELRTGNLVAAERLLRDSLALRERTGAAAFVACGVAQLARLHAWRGEFVEARRAIARALRQMRREPDDPFAFEVLLVTAEFHALRGRPGRARAAAKRLRGLPAERKPRRYEGAIGAFGALGALLAGDRAAAHAECVRARAAADPALSDSHLPLLLAIHAIVDDTLDTAKREAAVDAALRMCAGAGLAYERALVELLRGGWRFERGSALAAARDPESMTRALAALGGARDDADRAKDTFKRLGFADRELTIGQWRVRLAEREQGESSGRGFVGLDRRMRGMERLLEINKAINSELDPQRLLALILDSAISLCSARRGFVVLVRQNQVEVKIARNFSQQDVAHPEFEISHSVARGVARSGEPILTSNALSDQRLRSIASIHELRLLSILCVPLRSRNEVLGSIYLDHPDIVDRFDAADLALLTDFAWAAGIALERARLYQENLERANELLLAKQENERLNAELVRRVEQQEAELIEVKDAIEGERRVQALRYDYRNIVTESPKMQDVLRLIDRITETDFPVLIQGESGTGKELIARAIHFNGKRAGKSFVAVNCAAMTESLIEAELFGHVKGAFTGADRDRKGLFEIAHEGTLFLDEIGDMSLEVQKRLLRVIQHGEFYRLGAKDPIRVDVRILCATHRDLKAMIHAGSYREDLYYRIGVAQVDLPPLRERAGDVRLLITHLVNELKNAGQAPPRRFSDAALRVLERYAWPGNVRELQNEVKRLLFLRTDRPWVEVSDLSPIMTGAPPQPSLMIEGIPAGSLKERMNEIERRLVLETLRQCGGNKMEAARRLSISIRGLYNILGRGKDREDGPADDGAPES